MHVSVSRLHQSERRLTFHSRLQMAFRPAIHRAILPLGLADTIPLLPRPHPLIHELHSGEFPPQDLPSEVLPVLDQGRFLRGNSCDPLKIFRANRPGLQFHVDSSQFPAKHILQQLLVPLNSNRMAELVREARHERH